MKAMNVRVAAPAVGATAVPARSARCARAVSHSRATSSAVMCSGSGTSGFFGGEGWGRQALCRPKPAARPSRSQALSPQAVISLPTRNRTFKPTEVKVVKKLGEGSYGIVYEALWTKPGGSDERIVIKMSKSNVEGADEMRETELLLNAVVTRQAPGSCAPYMGSLVVDQEDERNLRDSGLKAGKYLVWRYEGAFTLALYMQRRDFPSGLSEEMMGCAVSQCGEKAVVQQTMIQIMQANKKLHDIGLVHRDIKPRNIILAETERSLKLVDLGACADLRRGTNYVPDESILDPMYCPPEQYVMPIDTIDIASASAPVQMAMTPMLWVKHRPDLFDSYSMGLVFLQLAVPAYRSEAGVRAFNTAFKRYNYDMEAWRANVQLQASQLAILDDDDGAGWELLEGLLRPRSIDEDVVYDGPGRWGLREALRSRFLRDAPRPFSFADAEVGEYNEEEDAFEAPGPRSSGLFGAVRDGIFNRLAQLEASINDLSTETERTQKKIAELQQEGGSESEIREAMGDLKKLEKELDSSVVEFTETAREAQSALVGEGQGEKGAAKAEEAEEEEEGVKSAKSAMEDAEAASRKAVAGGLLRFGMQFTGLAARVAGDVARELRRDAGKVIRDIQEEGAVEKELRRLRAEGKGKGTTQDAEASLQGKEAAAGEEEAARAGEVSKDRADRQAEAEARKQAALDRLEAARERTADIARRREKRIQEQQAEMEMLLARQAETLQSATSKLTKGKKYVLGKEDDLSPEEVERMKSEMTQLSSQVEQMTAAMRSMEKQLRQLEEERMKAQDLQAQAEGDTPPPAAAKAAAKAASAPAPAKKADAKKPEVKKPEVTKAGGEKEAARPGAAGEAKGGGKVEAKGKGKGKAGEVEEEAGGALGHVGEDGKKDGKLVVEAGGKKGDN